MSAFLEMNGSLGPRSELRLTIANGHFETLVARTAHLNAAVDAYTPPLFRHPTGRACYSYLSPVLMDGIIYSAE